MKGEGRPVIGEDQRLRILAALAAVDYVTVFTSRQLPELLAGLRPDILTKGSNYPEAQVAGAEIVQGYGGPGGSWCPSLSRSRLPTSSSALRMAEVAEAKDFSVSGPFPLYQKPPTPTPIP